MSEPVHPVSPAQPQPAQPGPHAPPVSPAGRTDLPGASDEPVRRKLLMGVALLLALTSIYVGVFNVGRVAQIVLAAAATMAMVLALTSNRRRNS